MGKPTRDVRVESGSCLGVTTDGNRAARRKLFESTALGASDWIFESVTIRLLDKQLPSPAAEWKSLQTDVLP